jgi:hypothetical protein
MVYSTAVLVNKSELLSAMVPAWEVQEAAEPLPDH